MKANLLVFLATVGLVLVHRAVAQERRTRFKD